MSEHTKEAVKIKTLVMLHGFGVRGFFWDPYIHSNLQNKFHQIFAPDLDFTTIEVAIKSTKQLVIDYHQRYGNMGPIFILGHSLGGILAAILAKELGPNIIEKIVIMASPYGEYSSSERNINIQRWFIKHDWLLPGFLTRRVFFTKKTPKKIQKALWKKTVKESNEFIDQIITKKMFHTELFSEPLKQESFVIAGKHDKSVKIDQTIKFAKVLGSKTKIYENVGHNDLVYAPNIATKVIEDIIQFLS